MRWTLARSHTTVARMTIIDIALPVFLVIALGCALRWRGFVGEERNAWLRRDAACWPNGRRREPARRARAHAPPPAPERPRSEALACPTAVVSYIMAREMEGDARRLAGGAARGMTCGSGCVGVASRMRRQQLTRPSIDIRPPARSSSSAGAPAHLPASFEAAACGRAGTASAARTTGPRPPAATAGG